MKTIVVEKPWGKFQELTKSESTTVKILTINPHHALSLQYHNHRSEFWKILLGHPTVTIGDKVVVASPEEEFRIEVGKSHRLEAGDELVEVLEISYGDFDENDIIRLEDKYGRA